MKYANILASLYGSALAIEPSALNSIEGILMDHVEGNLTEQEIEARASSRLYGANRTGGGEAPDATRVISLHGPIMNRAGMFSQMSGATSPQDFAAEVAAAAADDSVKQIVLDIDSPGGTVSGTEAAAAAVRDAAGVKTVVAVANDTMASAAYWIGSQATKIVGSQSAMVGSVGVIWPHRDLTGAEAMAGQKTTYIRSSKDKALGQPFEPLTDDVRQSMQAQVDDIAEVFRGSVSIGRGVSVDTVTNDWSASVFMGHKALEAGLIDEVGTLESVIASFDNSTMNTTTNGTSADAVTPTPTVADPAPASADAPDLLSPDAEAALASEVQRLKAELAVANSVVEKVEAEKAASRVEAMVSDALASGRALPIQADFLREQATENFDLVNAFIQGLPEGSVTPVGSNRVTPNAESREGAGGTDHAQRFLDQRKKADAEFVSPLRAQA